MRTAHNSLQESDLRCVTAPCSSWAENFFCASGPRVLALARGFIRRVSLRVGLERAIRLPPPCRLRNEANSAEDLAHIIVNSDGVAPL